MTGPMRSFVDLRLPYDSKSRGNFYAECQHAFETLARFFGESWLTPTSLETLNTIKKYYSDCVVSVESGTPKPPVPRTINEPIRALVESARSGFGLLRIMVLLARRKRTQRREALTFDVYCYRVSSAEVDLAVVPAAIQSRLPPSEMAIADEQ